MGEEEEEGKQDVVNLVVIKVRFIKIWKKKDEEGNRKKK